MYVMLPKFVDAHSQLIMFILDIFHIHHNLSFALRAAKVVAKVKKDVYRHQDYRDSLPRPN